MKINVKTKFINETANLIYAEYMDGSTALALHDDYGQPLMTATVALPNVVPGSGNVFIKNWSENEGILECLIEQNVISEPVNAFETGFVQVYECKLLD